MQPSLSPTTETEPLGEGAVLLRGFVSTDAPQIFAHVTKIAEALTFRHMITPGGFRMSIAITNCGKAGWISDHKGYRYPKLTPKQATHVRR